MFLNDRGLKKLLVFWELQCCFKEIKKEGCWREQILVGDWLGMFIFVGYWY